MKSSKFTIANIEAYEILDSHGNPTLRTRVTLNNGVSGVADVPSGTSTGEHEALELRDGGKRYRGKGVLEAVEHVNTKIVKALKGKDIFDQEAIDAKMISLDGTKQKEKLGANAILSVSLAAARAGSAAKHVPLYEYLFELYRGKKFGPYKDDMVFPVPLFNIFNGGKHADTNLDFQEFHIIPRAAKRYERFVFDEYVRTGAEVFHALGRVLLKKGMDTDVGIEGGYAPDIDSTIQALDLIMEAIRESGREPKKDVTLGVDAGSSSFFDQRKGEYHFHLGQEFLTRDQMMELVLTWAEVYPFSYIEDPLAQDDWHGWSELAVLFQKQKKRLQVSDLVIVGDDLLVTDVVRLQHAVRVGCCSGAIVKPNQIGTLTETFHFARTAQANDLKIVVSHRSGDTGDPFISDLAVAVGADFLKAGSLSRSERVEKYNRMMEIEREIRE